MIIIFIPAFGLVFGSSFFSVSYIFREFFPVFLFLKNSAIDKNGSLYPHFWVLEGFLFFLCEKLFSAIPGIHCTFVWYYQQAFGDFYMKKFIQRINFVH